LATDERMNGCRWRTRKGGEPKLPALDETAYYGVRTQMVESAPTDAPSNSAEASRSSADAKAPGSATAVAPVFAITVTFPLLKAATESGSPSIYVRVPRPSVCPRRRRSASRYISRVEPSTPTWESRAYRSQSDGWGSQAAPVSLKP